MPLRPARCYTERKKPPYTRREYIDGIPPPKITKYTMGNPHNQYKYVVRLIAEKNVLIRHNALEAARTDVHRYMSKYVGEDKYFFVVRKYPHQVIRENKMLAFAGADRLQEGMRQAFGKPIGTGAYVKPGDIIMDVYVSEREHVAHAIEALRRAKAKLPDSYKIVTEEISLGG
ncbi:MAG: 50S ribosomal protein L16 [Desulfurococcales archaeon]|nr:50S ribosomal protein L16 [Desulfurococcales archaeon]